MDPTTFADVAAMVAWFGVLGTLVAGLNVVALRVVRPGDVPGCMRGRILWWSAHNAAFLVISLVVTVAGLAALATA